MIEKNKKIWFSASPSLLLNKLFNIKQVLCSKGSPKHIPNTLTDLEDAAIFKVCDILGSTLSSNMHQVFDSSKKKCIVKIVHHEVGKNKKNRVTKNSVNSCKFSKYTYFYQKICLNLHISSVFGTNSKLCIFKVRAPRGSVSRLSRPCCTMKQSYIQPGL